MSDPRRMLLKCCYEGQNDYNWMSVNIDLIEYAMKGIECGVVISIGGQILYVEDKIGKLEEALNLDQMPEELL